MVAVFFAPLVTLDDAPVEISRELTVPSDLRLSHFAEILIRAMGWEGYHLNMFECDDIWYTDKDTFEQWQKDSMEHVECYNNFTVGDILHRKGSNAVWEYDLGDSWRHTLRVVENKPLAFGPMR